MRTLMLELEDSRGIRPLELCVSSLINLGYVGRNEPAVRHHIEELAKEGVPPPASIPMKIPMPLSALSLDEQIDVASDKTSGEVEIAFFFNAGKIYVGVGSDHTDRALETSNMALSKQVCPNVIGARVWDFNDVRENWDNLELRSWVVNESGLEVLYQDAPLKSMLSPQRLLNCARAALKNRSTDGLVVFSGTVGILNSKFVYSPQFRCELFNPATERRLHCAYAVRTLASVFLAD